MSIYQLGECEPVIDASAYVHEQATVIGKVVIGRDASIWPHATLRGDNATISVGPGSNVQDGSVLHTDPGCPLIIGEHVTIGHQVMLHGCEIGDRTLVGIQSIILNRAKIGQDCLVGAGSLITEGKVFPDRSLILGRPAKVVRELTEVEVAAIKASAENYAARGKLFQETLVKIR